MSMFRFMTEIIALQLRLISLRFVKLCQLKIATSKTTFREAAPKKNNDLAPVAMIGQD